ncbi:hypothetical protein U1Q18_005961, partial [Sarracenia purpurea var. burkii]
MKLVKAGDSNRVSITKATESMKDGDSNRVSKPIAKRKLQTGEGWYSNRVSTTKEAEEIAACIAQREGKCEDFLRE